MKKTLLKKIGLLFVASFMTFGCAEDFLEETNPVELSTSSFWKTYNDLNVGLNAVYNGFKDESNLRLVDELNRSDMTFPGWGRPNTSNVYYLQTFNNSSTAPNAKWSALYKGIFRANQVLEAAEKLYPDFDTATKEDADILIAQTRGLRGLFYFYLHSSFNNGSVPIFDFVPQSTEEYYQPVQPSATVQEFFRADLEYAMENLPMSYPTGQEGRLTSGAAIALLGKSYLYDGDYTMAAQYFKTIIDDYPYSLTPDIGSNFTTRDEFNEESILEIGYSLGFKNNEPSPWGEQQNSSGLNFSFSPVGGWRSVYPALWLNLAYQKDSIDTKDPRNFVTRVARQANGLPQTDENGEVVMEENVPRIFSLRASASVAFANDLDTDYYQVTSPQGANYNNGEHCYWRKFTNWDIAENERDVSDVAPRSGVNVRLIRLADVYLMYAESLIKGGTDNGGVDEALVYINRVRRRSGLILLGLSGTGEYPINDHDDAQYTASSLMDHLMFVERPLELSAEGHAIRTIDLRRWGITKQRFEDLASRTEYYRDDFRFENEDGDSATRWSSIVSDIPTVIGMNRDGGPWTDKWYEFREAAVNYMPDSHAYWPIPNSEETANPKIYDTN